MMKRFLMIGALGIAAAPAFAEPSAPEPILFQTIVVQGGQGSPVTLQVRMTALPEVQAYSLTGEKVPAGPRSVSMRFGQGDLVAVPVSR